MPIGASRRATVYAGLPEAAQSLPAMTGNQAPTGHSSRLVNSTNPEPGLLTAFEWFDQSAATSAPLSPAPVSITRETPAVLRVAAYALREGPVGGLGAPNTWELQGGSGASGPWIMLDSRSGQAAWAAGERRQFVVDPHRRASFRFHRLAVSIGNYEFVRLAEFELLKET